VTDAEKDERLQLTYKRRIREVLKKHGMEPLSRARMHYLTSRLVRVRGDYVSDPDLRVLARLVHRGFID